MFCFFKSFSSSDIDDDDDDDDDRRHHLLQMNGELLPDNDDDDDTEDSLYEPDIVKVCFFIIENMVYKPGFIIVY